MRWLLSTLGLWVALDVLSLLGAMVTAARRERAMRDAWSDEVLERLDVVRWSRQAWTELNEPPDTGGALAQPV